MNSKRSIYREKSNRNKRKQKKCNKEYISIRKFVKHIFLAILKLLRQLNEHKLLLKNNYRSFAHLRVRKFKLALSSNGKDKSEEEERKSDNYHY